MQTSVTELPFNAFIGIQRASLSPYVLSLPASEHYANHLGTVHASAQLALAEASSGEFLLERIGTISNLIPVVRRLESKFRKPAAGRLNSMVTTPQAAIDHALTEIASRGRTLIRVDVELHDETGAVVMSAIVDWFITRTAVAPQEFDGTERS